MKPGLLSPLAAAVALFALAACAPKSVKLGFVDHIKAGMIEQNVYVEKAAGSGEVFRINPDGSPSFFMAGADGSADFKRDFSRCLERSGERLMAMLAIAYHSDGNTYGPNRDPSASARTSSCSSPCPTSNDEFFFEEMPAEVAASSPAQRRVGQKRHRVTNLAPWSSARRWNWCTRITRLPIRRFAST